MQIHVSFVIWKNIFRNAHIPLNFGSSYIRYNATRWTGKEIAVLKIKERVGAMPVTNSQPPHLQITEQSPRDIYNALNDWVFNSFDLVREEPTRISVPTSRAMWLHESVEATPDAFMPPVGSREFAHTHKDGSMHLMLHGEDERIVMEAGWGELHPWHHRGVREILVYAPRDKDELETVKTIVKASYDHVMSSAERYRGDLAQRRVATV